VTVLVNALGRPEPSPEVQRRLRAVHPNLFLRFIDHLPTMWAVCWRWEENDRRWAEVQSGEVDPARAHDIVGYLPMDCSVDEAPAHLHRVMRTYPKEEVAALADRVLRFNETQALEQQVNAVLQELTDSPDPTGLTKTRRGRKVKVSPVV
jgi:hypothetical protein